MIRYAFSRFCAAVALVLAGLTAGNAQTELDFAAWNRLADRADEVTRAAAASDAALAVLRADLSEWQQRLEAARGAAEIDYLRVVERQEALGEAIAGESGALSERRNRIETELLQAAEPFFVAGDAVRVAEGLIARIDDIDDERRRQAFRSRGPSPLNPLIWGEAAAQAGAYLASLVDEVSAALAGDAQRRQLSQELPLILLLLGVGGLLLTLARRWSLRLAERIFPAPHGVPLRGGGIRLLISNAVLPWVGVLLLLTAVERSGLTSVYGENILRTIPAAAAIIFTANWLAISLFAGDGSELVSFELGADWSTSVRRVISLLGWVVAAGLVAEGLVTLSGPDSNAAIVWKFVIMLLAALLMFRLGHRLSEHLSSLAASDMERPIGETVFSAVIFLIRAAAVAGIVSAVAGYGALGEYVIYPPLFSLALLGAYFAIETLFSSLVSDIAEAVGFQPGAGRIGLIRVCVGTILLIIALPVLALAWGADWSDIEGAWSQVREGVTLGGQQITAGAVFSLLIIFIVGCVITALLQSVLKRAVLPNTRLDVGAQRALTTGTGYVGVILAATVAVAVAGINLTSVAIVAGALSVGIGFGLQTIVSNFVSGIILLIERPITVGDWIETSSVSGTVRRISVRSTQIETFDRARVIVPNSDLISGQVTNWTLQNRIGRIILPIGVAYGSDTRLVERILLQVAEAHPAVLEDPAPAAIFKNFGADALEFELRVILSDVNFLLSARSDLNFAIAERFDQEGISIPFPQRDIWLRNAADLFPAGGDAATSE
ncbi:MAG: DUF3772 domain-containing protein [Rhodobacteraceae bacterium]|nr:DUF3772 domain-containing protein [Paracoccaceae bacterium]